MEEETRWGWGGAGRWFGGGAVLKGDEVHQVAFGWSHAVREEVDQGVEELRPLGIRLVHVRESCKAAGNIVNIVAKYGRPSVPASFSNPMFRPDCPHSF